MLIIFAVSLSWENLVINEFKSDSVEKDDLKEFIELKLYEDLDNNDHSLDGYYILAVEMRQRGKTNIQVLKVIKKIFC